jgi:Uma2 family endonuclease
MADGARRLLTVEEFLATEFDPLLGGSPELWDGEVFYRASPRSGHSGAQRRIGSALGDLEPDDPDAAGWWILPEIDWKLGPRRLLRPDVAGWRRERHPDPPTGVMEIAPDWVCEILSPGRADHDLKFKAGVYLEQRVPWYWVVHADDGVVQVLRNAGAEWAVQGSYARGDLARIPPFEELEIDVGKLFLPVRPPSGS